MAAPHMNTKFSRSSKSNRDREFNSPGCGGGVYIGFRVAVGEEGFRKLSH